MNLQAKTNHQKPAMLSLLLILLCYTGLTCLLLEKANADGFIVVPVPHVPVAVTSQPFPLEVKYHHVEVEITDRTATTAIDQEFYNPTAQTLEGEYIFPLPEGAVIQKFSMFINGKEIPAELLDATKAREIYLDIVRKLRDPALLEYQERAVFRARIFPIEPYARKRVKITYQEIIDKDNGTLEYIYPLNTEKFSAAPLENVSIKVNLKTSAPLKNIYCTSHETEIIRKNGNAALISYEEHQTKPTADFKLYFTTTENAVGLSLLTYREAGSNYGTFFLDITSGLTEQENMITSKDILFVLDTSGSMAGEKLEQAKKALLFCLSNLNAGDRFEIIRFSTEAEALFQKLAVADRSNINQAKAYLTTWRALGGTNIDEALGLALQSLAATGHADGRPQLVVFITDGKPTIGETTEEKLLKKIQQANLAKVRIFTFGIGFDINTHLLDKITSLTRAYRTYIAPDEDLEVGISTFYAKVQSPVLTDLRLTISGAVHINKTHPVLTDLPDLFKGSAITLLGQYTGSGPVTITLKGKLGSQEKHYTYQVNFSNTVTGSDSLPALWAARRVGYLLDQIRLVGESQELKEEVIELARQYGIVTPYTSYLILEDEQNRVASNRLQSDFQTIAPLANQSADLTARTKKEYGSMQAKSGKESIQASEETQALNNAANDKQARQGMSRMNYTDAKGNYTVMEQQVRNIQGRAFYNAGSFWVDSRLQTKSNTKPQRIQFASKEYFKLLKDAPEAAMYLALGQNVRFLLNNSIIEIYE